MAIERWSQQVWLVRLANEPALSEDLLSLRELAAGAAAAPSMVIDFTGVTQINSSNLSQLLRVRKVAIDRDTKLLICGLSDAVWTVFLTTGLDKVFEYRADLSTALASIQIDKRV